MKYWVDYYDQRSKMIDDPLIASEMNLTGILIMELEYEKLIRYLNPNTTQTLLDIGCSNGNGIALLKDCYKAFIGIDLSPNSIIRCQTRFPEYEYFLDVSQVYYVFCSLSSIV